MLRVIDLRGRPAEQVAFARPADPLDEARERVRPILEAVRERGDDALRELTLRLDGVDVADPRVPPELLAERRRGLEPELAEAIERAAGQIRWFHERARPRDWETSRDGATVGQRHSSLRRVGVYVPGGSAAYPSTVLMTVVPARVAGVGEVVLCTPPARQGDADAERALPNPTVLAAASLLGVDVVVAVGGAQAIAAMAYGTAMVPRCDKVVGPGNAYVAAAKQLVQAEGRCGVDAIAGPTEVAIVADGSADARLVAADLVAQAEHDELATCLLVTTSTALVEAVAGALEEEVARARHRRRIEAALRGQGLAIVTDDLEHAVEVVDVLAPEHVEVHTEDAAAVAATIRFAGAIFVGASTPVSLGDYAAGPNHTLPTSGAARFRGGLSTADFLVPVNWVAYTAQALADLAPAVRALSAAEGLPAHARAVDVRLEQR